MNSARDENPYLPPESQEEVPTKKPGPAAMLLVTVASVGAWVFGFYGTCYGFIGMIRAVGPASPISNILGLGWLITPLPAAYFAARYVRRTLMAKLTKYDEDVSP